MARWWFFLVLLNSSSFSATLLLHLAELQLSSQYLILLLLKGSLSFLQSSLQLLLFLLQTTSLFVQVMDGAASLTELIK